MDDATTVIATGLAVAIGAPLVGAVLAGTGAGTDHPRRISAACIAASLAGAVAATWAWTTCESCSAGWAWEAGPGAPGAALLRFDALTAVLLPYALVLALVTALAVPRRDIPGPSARRSLLGTALTSALLLSAHPAALVALWAATALAGWWSIRAAPEGRGAARAYATYMVPAVALMAVGTWLMAGGAGGAARSTGAWMLAAAVMVRKGIFPFHSWYPAVFEGAPVSSALGITMPQVAAYTAVRLLTGHVGDGVPPQLEFLAAASLLTCVYGAALAVVQPNVRGLVGTLAMSQSALVLAGLAGTRAEELCGAIAVWVSSGIVLTGIALVARSLEARAGTLSLESPQGRFADAPGLAACFLILGLAGAGLPGTFSFVADDLIVSGSLEHHVGAGLMVIASTVLSAIALLRGWFRLFGGPPASGPRHPVLPREVAAFAALVAVTFVIGTYPAPFVRASEQIAASIAPGAHGASGHVTPDHGHTTGETRP